MMKLKRIREIDAHEDLTSMANCLMLLSGGGESNTNRVFECKTCNRQFASFQALGGHRASHKKPRLSMITDHTDSTFPTKISLSPPKPKSHECSICGVEFPIGQALGGHMRRHRTTVKDPDPDHTTFSSLSLPQTPIIKKSNSRRVFCMDLNLTPSENKFLYGNLSPRVGYLF